MREDGGWRGGKKRREENGKEKEEIEDNKEGEVRKTLWAIRERRKF